MAISNQNPTAAYPIPVAHTTDYFSKGIDREGPYYRVEYLIDSYANADDFVNFLMGYATASGSVFDRRAPHQHPLSRNLYCKSAEVGGGLGAPSLNAQGLPAYAGGARVRAEYRPLAATAGPPEMTPNELQQQIDQGTPLLWCTQEIEGSVESFLIPSKSLVFTSDGKKAEVPARKVVPLMIMNLTYHRVPYLPVLTLANAQAAPLNLTTFLGCPERTVLFRNFKTVREYQTDGTVAQKVMMSYARRPVGLEWDKLPHPTTGVFENVTIGVDGDPLYAESDLNSTLIF